MINKIDFKAKNLDQMQVFFCSLRMQKAMGFLILLKMTSYLIMTQQIKSR